MGIMVAITTEIITATMAEIIVEATTVEQVLEMEVMMGQTLVTETTVEMRAVTMAGQALEIIVEITEIQVQDLEVEATMG
ncbi:MAG: hypothetical protein E6248_03875 [Clostridium sp.]|uniref:hypothetical protein n=1 Tax=Clostridium sp. TaxID=1506 RepID=UPI00291332FB|nr:hypothetical protein [Clostridium sp.]MDU5109560.1 hypothetical protein [Clostridium sp.]